VTGKASQPSLLTRAVVCVRSSLSVSVSFSLGGKAVPHFRIWSPQQNASGQWFDMQPREVGNLVVQLWKMRWLQRPLWTETLSVGSSFVKAEERERGKEDWLLWGGDNITPGVKGVGPGQFDWGNSRHPPASYWLRLLPVWGGVVVCSQPVALSLILT